MARHRALLDSLMTSGPGLFVLLLVWCVGCVPVQTVPAPTSPVPSSNVLTPLQQQRFAESERRVASADAEVRLQAAIALLAMEHPGAAEVVLNQMRAAEDAAVRASMVQAAAFWRDHRCFASVLAALDDESPEVRQAAATALARFTRPDEVAATMAKARTVDAPGRCLIYRALGGALAIQATEVLLEGLEAQDAESRQAAWEALRRISGRSLPPEVAEWRAWWEANSQKTREEVLEEHLAVLAERLAARDEELGTLAEQQEELLHLVQSAQSASPAPLIQALGSRHSVVRRYASFRLASIAEHEDVPVSIDKEETYALLASALEDEAESVRENVLRFVLSSNGAYREALVRKALQDTSRAVLKLAMQSIENGVALAMRDRLCELLRSSADAEVRAAAANVLGRIAAPDAQPVLLAALDDPEENVRWFAVEGLRKLTAIDAVPRIAELLEKDGSARVREIAASTLGELGRPAGVPALRVALGDQHERVRQKAVAALMLLASGSYERMVGIADAFREAGLNDKAQEVLGKAIATYRDTPEMSARVVLAYGSLAQLQEASNTPAAAAQTYAELDDFTGGAVGYRAAAVRNWLAAGDPARAVAAVERWFAAAGPEPGPEMIDLGLTAAEQMLEAGYAQEAASLLALMTEAAGPEPASEVQSRIARIRRRTAG
jgi:HEAT repeat protein